MEGRAIAVAIVWVFQVYAGLGLLFAIGFVIAGVQRIDPAAGESRWGFRLMLIPGAAAFWPWLLLRWLRGQPPKSECNAHRAAAQGGRS